MICFVAMCLQYFVHVWSQFKIYYDPSPKLLKFEKLYGITNAKDVEMSYDNGDFIKDEQMGIDDFNLDYDSSDEFYDANSKITQISNGITKRTSCENSFLVEDSITENDNLLQTEIVITSEEDPTDLDSLQSPERDEKFNVSEEKTVASLKAMVSCPIADLTPQVLAVESTSVLQELDVESSKMNVSNKTESGPIKKKKLRFSNEVTTFSFDKFASVKDNFNVKGNFRLENMTVGVLNDTEDIKTEKDALSSFKEDLLMRFTGYRQWRLQKEHQFSDHYGDEVAVNKVTVRQHTAMSKSQKVRRFFRKIRSITKVFSSHSTKTKYLSRIFKKKKKKLWQ